MADILPENLRAPREALEARAASGEPLTDIELGRLANAGGSPENQARQGRLVIERLRERGLVFDVTRGRNGDGYRLRPELVTIEGVEHPHRITLGRPRLVAGGETNAL